MNTPTPIATASRAGPLPSVRSSQKARRRRAVFEEIIAGSILPRAHRVTFAAEILALRNPSRPQILTAQALVHPLPSEPPAWIVALLPIDAAARHPLPGETASPASRVLDGILAVARGDLLRARLVVRGARALDPD